MNIIPSGKSKGRVKSVRAVVSQGRKSTRKEKAEVVTSDELDRIEVLRRGPIVNIAPAHVLAQSPFTFEPQDFGLESEALEEKIVSEQVQMRSLKRFLKDPTSPVIYGVAGSPDDMRARYFAAYLVQAHVKHLGARANVKWITLYGDYKNVHLADDVARPSMVVLTNLAPNSTNVKLEKARDIIEFYSDVPCVVVNAGMDPMSFLMTRLYCAVNAMAYFSLGLVKQRVKVI